MPCNDTGRNKTTKSGIPSKQRELQTLEADPKQKWKKDKKNTLEEPENFLKPSSTAEIYLGNKHLDGPLCKILWIILKMGKRRAQILRIKGEENWLYLPVPASRQGLTRGQWPEGRLKWGLRGWVGRERIETRNLLVCAGHWLP